MEIGHYTAHHDEPGANDSNINSKYRQVFRLKMVHLLAFFILVYVGVEVTIGGASSMDDDDDLTTNLAFFRFRVDCHIYYQC